MKIYEQCIILDIVCNFINEDCWKFKDFEENMLCLCCVEFVLYFDSIFVMFIDSYIEIFFYI